MKIQCDVCEEKCASVICCADEAALCSECDMKVHEANKLASKHKRLSLLASSSRLSKCDICLDKTAFVFCLEDRALLCRDCDEAVHLPDTLGGQHQRFLATGIRVANPNSNSLSPVPSRKPSQPAAYVEPNWSVDELLPLSDFDSNKGDEGFNKGEFDWNLEDMGLFGEEDLAQVPQLSAVSRAPPMDEMNGRAGKPSPSLSKGKSKTTHVPDFDETSFIVPNIGMVQSGYLSAIPAKGIRENPFFCDPCN